MEVYNKDPDETLDYQITWSTYLGTDTVSTSTWILESGITEVSTSNTTTTTTIFISGGTVGNAYKVTNRITTAGGRTIDRSIYLNIVTDHE